MYEQFMVQELFNGAVLLLVGLFLIRVNGKRQSELNSTISHVRGERDDERSKLALYQKVIPLLGYLISDIPVWGAEERHRLADAFRKPAQAFFHAGHGDEGLERVLMALDQNPLFREDDGPEQ
jgi:hypothetical protein